MTSWCLQPALATHRGLHRTRNEDSVNYLYPTNNGLRQQYGAIFVIADGVGGMKGGLNTSYITVTLLMEQYYKSKAATIEARLTEGIHLANQTVFQQFSGKSASTVVAAVFHGTDLIVAHVGDSRAYWITRSGISPLTEDHTVNVREKGRTKSKLNRAVGLKPSVQPDVIRLPALLHGTLLLVTDGVTNYLKDKQLERIILNSEPAAAVATIVAEANRAGGMDNITAAAVHVMSPCQDAASAVKHIQQLERDPILTTDGSPTKGLLITGKFQIDAPEPIPEPDIKRHTQSIPLSQGERALYIIPLVILAIGLLLALWVLLRPV
jgi:PPM family protein phosphatase